MAYCNCPNCYETYEGVKPKVCKKCGFPFKGSNENDKEYIRLFAMFNSKPTEELEAIINSDEEYTHIAKRVARDIIDTGRTEYKEQVKRYKEEQQRQEAIQQEKYNNLLTNPLYDDIHQIAGDLRFIKNLIILGIVCSIILGIIDFLSFINLF